MYFRYFTMAILLIVTLRQVKCGSTPCSSDADCSNGCCNKGTCSNYQPLGQPCTVNGTQSSAYPCGCSTGLKCTWFAVPQTGSSTDIAGFAACTDSNGSLFGK